MNDPSIRGGPRRSWRQDDGAMLAGVCIGLSEDLDLPLPLVRMVAVLFLVLPTGLAYLALTLLLRRRQPAWNLSGGRDRTYPGENGRRARPAGMQHPGPAGQGWALLQQRFAMLEPRLKNIEAFVASSDFELHRGFRRMGE